jgi:hypothetical protein
VLTTGGNVDCYGYNAYGQAEDYAGGDAMGVSVGRYHTCVLTTDGNVDCYGYNAYGQAEEYTGGDGVCGPSQDADGDGVNDDVDICPDTPAGEIADEDGCSASQRDTDGDGVNDDVDICPDTPAGEIVDEDGCSASQRDTDGDGVNDDVDLCPYEDASGFDTDGDGCIDSLTGLTEVVETLVIEDAISGTLENSVDSKVDNASQSVDKGDICSAVNKLESLQNEVNAQRGKKITDEAADAVISYTDSVIAFLLSQLPSGESC